MTDGEGGNIRLKWQDGNFWEIDAANGTYGWFRIFSYGNTEASVKNYKCIMTANHASGVPAFPQGIHELGTFTNYVGNQLGWGAISFAGRATAIKLVSRYLIKVTGVVYARSGESSSDYFSGLSWDAISSFLSLENDKVPSVTWWTPYNGDGTMMMDRNQYTGTLQYKESKGANILLPGRYYTSEGAWGGWESTSKCYAPGTYWDCMILTN